MVTSTTSTKQEIREVKAGRPSEVYSYNENRLGILLRDPGCFFLYWNLDNSKKEMLEALKLNRGFLRIYENDAPWTPIKVNINGGNWYVNSAKSNTRYYGKLIIPEAGLFDLCSNEVKTPRNCVSDDISEKWGTFNEQGKFAYSRSTVRKDNALTEKIFENLQCSLGISSFLGSSHNFAQKEKYCLLVP